MRSNIYAATVFDLIKARKLRLDAVAEQAAIPSNRIYRLSAGVVAWRQDEAERVSLCLGRPMADLFANVCVRETETADVA